MTHFSGHYREIYLSRHPGYSYKKFANLSLAPGDTKVLHWVDFHNRTSVPPTGFMNICFWTSHPDFRLDANSTNDGLCMDFLVSDQEPTIEFGFNIYPNPSSVGSTVTYELPSGSDSRIRVFNNMGILMESRQIMSSDGTLALGKYPAGLYYVTLEMDSLPVKVLKLVQL